MRTRTSLIRLSPPRGAEPRSRRQSQSSQAAQRREALFSPISKYGVSMSRLADGAGAFCRGRSASKLIGKTAPEHREDGRLFRLQTRKDFEISWPMPPYQNLHQ